MRADRTKILTILSRVPYPLEKGDKLRAYHQIKQLQKRFDVILVCLTFSEPNIEQKKALENICSKLYFIKLNKWRLPFELFKTFKDRLPFQVHYFYQKKAQKQIDRIIQQEQPKKIFAQLIRTFNYIEEYSLIPIHLDYMDAFSTGMKRRAEKSSNPIKKVLFNLEFELLKKFELKSLTKLKKGYIISEQDRSSLDMPNDIEILPNGVDLSYFSPINEVKQYDLLFTGNMSYPPNVMAASYIVNKLLPEVHKTHPDVKVCIAGANPSPQVKQLESEHVHITGWMDDIREAYGASKVFVAPMQIGTGLQNKLLEAMSMQLPCISSELANNALKAKPDTEILIAEGKEEWVEKINLLLDSSEERERISKAGKSMINQVYSWEKNTEILIQNLEK